MSVYVVVIERADDGGWGPYLPDLPGVVALGTTRDEVSGRVRGVLDAYIRRRWTSQRSTTSTRLSVGRRASRPRSSEVRTAPRPKVPAGRHIASSGYVIPDGDLDVLATHDGEFPWPDPRIASE